SPSAAARSSRRSTSSICGASHSQISRPRCSAWRRASRRGATTAFAAASRHWSTSVHARSSPSCRNWIRCPPRRAERATGTRGASRATRRPRMSSDEIGGLTAAQSWQNARAAMRDVLRDTLRPALLAFVAEGLRRGYTIEFADAPARRFARLCRLIDGEAGLPAPRIAIELPGELPEAAQRELVARLSAACTELVDEYSERLLEQVLAGLADLAFPRVTRNGERR